MSGGPLLKIIEFSFVVFAIVGKIANFFHECLFTLKIEVHFEININSRTFAFAQRYSILL